MTGTSSLSLESSSSLWVCLRRRPRSKAQRRRQQVRRRQMLRHRGSRPPLHHPRRPSPRRNRPRVRPAHRQLPLRRQLLLRRQLPLRQRLPHRQQLLLRPQLRLHHLPVPPLPSRLLRLRRTITARRPRRRTRRRRRARADRLPSPQPSRVLLVAAMLRPVGLCTENAKHAIRLMQARMASGHPSPISSARRLLQCPDTIFRLP